MMPKKKVEEKSNHKFKSQTDGKRRRIFQDFFTIFYLRCG